MVTSGKPDLIRRYNRDLIQELILENGPVTKVELARLSGASVPTVNKIVNQLEADGLICSLAEGSNTVGRKAVSYIVNKDAGYFILFFVQNACIRAGLANSYGEILLEKNYTPEMASLESVNGALFDAAGSFIREIPREKLKAIGLGVPGVIDAENRITVIPTVPCWEGFDLKTLLEEKYGIPVFLENDVKLMTVGVYRREFSEKCRNMVFLYVSEGLGAGIVINGRLYKGENSFAGEYGFMLPNFERAESHSGSTGDLEYSLRPLAEKKIRGEAFTDAESERYEQILSGIITNFTAVLNPDVISVCSPDLTESELLRIGERTKMRIPDNCMPLLAITREEDYGINGVAEMCMTGINSKISLIDETGL